MEEDLAAIKLEVKGLFEHHQNLHAIFSDAYHFGSPGVSAVMFDKLCATEKSMTALSRTARTVLGSGFEFSTPFTEMLNKPTATYDDDVDLHLWMQDSDCENFVSDVETDNDD